MKIQFINTFIVLCLFTLVYSPTFGQSQNQEAQELQQTEHTMDVKVKGVGCAMDIKTIAEHVTGLEGVSSCETIERGAVTSFRITYNTDQIKEEAIHKTIEDTPGCTDPDARPYKVKQ